MKRTIRFLLAALFTVGLSLAAGQTESKEPGVRDGVGGMLILGEQTVDGLRAMPHLQDVTAARTRMGMKETHRFMVAFVDTATAEPLASGVVVLLIKSPSGAEGEAVRLMAMEGYFGADLILAEKGVYTFVLGTKVGGEKRRQFEFRHEIK